MRKIINTILILLLFFMNNKVHAQKSYDVIVYGATSPAMAVKNKEHVQEVNYTELEKKLLSSGQVLSLQQQ